jgi:hypothetical protein
MLLSLIGFPAQAQVRHSYPWYELIAPANVPNWCLVVVGGLAAGMAYWTLRCIEKQADHLRIQTDLMREQMDMMVQKERARLDIYPQPLKFEKMEGGIYYLDTCIELRNTGQSKAYIVFSASRFVVTGLDQSALPQPDPDGFSLDSNVVEPSGEPVYAGFFIDDIPITFEDMAESLANGESAAYLYGFIDYETLGIKHHCNFGYVWTIDEGKRNSGLYNSEKLIAEGEWVPSLRQRRSEREKKPN